MFFPSYLVAFRIRSITQGFVPLMASNGGRGGLEEIPRPLLFLL